MRALWLVRHGHAETGLLGQPDHERALSPQGEQEVRELAQRFHGKISPSLAVVSPARRTQQTAGLLLEAFPSCVVHTEKSLYLAEVQALNQILLSFPATHFSIALIGHNPGLSEWIIDLCREPCLFETAGAVLLHSEASSWDDFIVQPRKIVFSHRAGDLHDA